MASSIPLVSPKDFPIELQMEWYKIRDLFFGDNYTCQNIPLALSLASLCAYPDAQWLGNVCKGKNVNTNRDAEQVFRALDRNDARALCFGWLVAERRLISDLKRSAKLGFAFAQAIYSYRSDSSLKYAQLAANQGERDGYRILGHHYLLCIGENNNEKAKENLLQACRMDAVSAMTIVGNTLKDDDPQKWYWSGQAAARGRQSHFFCNFPEQIGLFRNGAKNNAVIFLIGRALKNHIDEDAKTIFDTQYEFDFLIADAKQAVSFYQSQLKASRRAVDAWTMVAKRLNVCRDIRKLIGQQIWLARDQGMY